MKRPTNRAAVFTVVIAMAIFLAGCTTTKDPFTGEERTSKANKGAMIGAAAGAVAGIISGDDARERRKRALIGAGVGAIAGGATGSYMDKQEAELRKQMESTGVSVSRNGDNITLNMPGNITFASNSADLNSEFFQVLDSVALVLNKYEKTLIEIAGHTDSTGSDDLNQRLSEQRANSVASYLRSHKVVPDRIAAFGLGKKHPVADNATTAGRAQNRRVELTLVPITQ
ncbi:MAG: OmpA/MotB domain-containing protein [Gammaproteobacteria bacterium]|nr:MAG: OmpA/MotB domain-containing protein [Gammaproteobacteria bacterium]TND05800.1 MAG: OmpA/MotB domain-containing protein [Gammaproteobacteria bacterium]